MTGAGRIGIDGDALERPLAGVGHYVFNLCRELDRLMPATRFFVYTRVPAKQLMLPSGRWEVRQEKRPVLRKLPSFLWLKTRGLHLCRQDQLDLFWGCRTLHAGRGAARMTAVTIHDFNHRVVPETMEGITRWSHACWFDRDILSADRVYANSFGTANRLKATLGRTADAVMQPGVNASFVPLTETEAESAQHELDPIGIAQPYLLAVSTLEPRKNVEALVDAFVALRRSGQLLQHRLVLVGAGGWRNKRLAKKIASARAWGVICPGYVPDDLMPAVYASADMLIMPSLYEGFGMPVLEARAMGRPVVVTDIPELREAAGARAFLVDGSVASIASGILRALHDGGCRDDLPDGARGWRSSGERLAKEFEACIAAVRKKDSPTQSALQAVTAGPTVSATMAAYDPQSHPAIPAGRGCRHDEQLADPGGVEEVSR